MNSPNSENKFSDNVASIEDSYQAVREWLQTLYGDREIPDFEVNEATISILHRIMDCNKTADRDAKEMIKNRLQMTDWYMQEGEKMNNALAVPGLRIKMFPVQCQEAVNSLAKATSTLDLKDPSLTSFLLGLNALSREQSASSKKKTTQLCVSSKLSNKLNSLLLKTQRFQRDLRNAEDAAKAQSQQEDKRVKQTGFLQNKQEEYCRTIKNLEDRLVLSGIDESICHQTLVNKSEELKKLVSRLDDVTAKLGSYQNLPPNENLARLKIEESKEELFRLEKELQMNICSKQ